MFSKDTLERLLAEIKAEWGSLPEWEELLRDTYLGIARADVGVALGDIDPRVTNVIQRYSVSE